MTRAAMLTTLRNLCVALGFAALICGCAGGTAWAGYADAQDLRSASDFDLCHRYPAMSKLNAHIGSELVRRGLLSKQEAADPPPYGQKGLQVGDKKCLVLMQPEYWKAESDDVTDDGHHVEVWRALDCEPSILTLFGATCGYEEITFEDGLVASMSCHETRLKGWCPAEVGDKPRTTDTKGR